MYYNLTYRKIDNNVIIYPSFNINYMNTISFDKSFYRYIPNHTKALLIDLKNDNKIIKENCTYHFIIDRNGKSVWNEKFDIPYIIEQIYLELKRRFNNRMNIIIHLPKILLSDIKNDYEYIDNYFKHCSFDNIKYKINIISKDHLIFGHQNNKYQYYIDFSNNEILVNYFNKVKEM